MGAKSATKGKYNIHWWIRVFFSSTACLKNEKMQKDKVQSVKEWKKYKKNAKKHKNTKCIFESNGKNPKDTQIQSVFVFILIFGFWPKKYQKNTKNTNAISQKKQNTKKKTNQKFQK